MQGSNENSLACVLSIAYYYDRDTKQHTCHIERVKSEE